MSALQKAETFIREQLQKEHSRHNSDLIVAWMEENKTRVQALINVLFEGDKLLHQRGSYVLWIMRHKKLHLIRPHLGDLVDYLPQSSHDAYGRALTSIISEMELDMDEELLGKIADYCFTAIENPNTAIAIRAHSMSILANLCAIEPDLIDEVEELIKTFYEEGTAGYQSRARTVFKQLKNIRKNTQS